MRAALTSLTDSGGSSPGLDALLHGHRDTADERGEGDRDVEECGVTLEGSGVTGRIVVQIFLSIFLTMRPKARPIWFT